MKILIAQKSGQSKENDFFWTNDGELLLIGFQCCNSDSCGCGRGFSGMDTRKASTTATVNDSYMTKQEYINKLMKSEYDAGFKFLTIEQITKQAEELLRIASMFYEGDTIRRHNEDVYVDHAKEAECH